MRLDKENEMKKPRVLGMNRIEWEQNEKIIFVTEAEMTGITQNGDEYNYFRYYWSNGGVGQFIVNMRRWFINSKRTPVPEPEWATHFLSAGSTLRDEEKDEIQDIAQPDIL